MSYCRKGPDSDVYVYRGGNGEGGYCYICCYCIFLLKANRDFGPIELSMILNTRQDMIDHLTKHREHGDKVPQYAIDRLVDEMSRE